MKPLTRQDFYADHYKQAEKILAEHGIRQHQRYSEKEASWIIGKGDSSAFRVQIVVLPWGRLLVQGDIHPVLFAQYSGGDPEGCVNWMGKSEIDYVAEKASIAMGHEIVYSTDDAVALGDIVDRITDMEADQDLSNYGKRELGVWRTARDRFLEGEDLGDVQDTLYSEGADCECVGGLGGVVSGRVLWAHSMTQKLTRLLAG